VTTEVEPILSMPAPEPEGNAPSVVIIGAGPAGLTAALGLVKRGANVVVAEADSVVGGISRTVEREGWRFDIGGHRFFTKVPEVEAFWNEVLPGDDFMVRGRKSRIFYNKKFYDYPLRPMNALSNLGLVESVKCVSSYAWARVRPHADTTSFEGWVSSRFGWRLYRTFFKTYTEKVWGVPADEIEADWAAQRIKNLSLGKAVFNALPWRKKKNQVVSLIEQFQYPKLGPGMMWEVCRDKVVAGGGEVLMSSPVEQIGRGDAGATSVRIAGRDEPLACDGLVSSMPLSALVRAFDPPAPAEVVAAADGLRYRDFLTVALVVDAEHAFDDNWIYVHDPEVNVGRIQNFGTWSPYMVQDGRTCLGLEYFVNEHDHLWDAADDDLIALGRAELVRLGLVPAGSIHQGYVVRMPKAYPVYDAHYAANVDTIRHWLAEHVPNVQAVGRNGMHRYNNQDHSMLTAMLAVENLMDGADHDLWQVNVDAEYHEERSADSTASGASGTGRMAPVFR
jgi:protoporphyrinogen oxidase